MHVPVLPAGGFGPGPRPMRGPPLLREASSDPYVPRISAIRAVYSDGAAARFVRRAGGGGALGVVGCG